jgi:tape measure domain-containing protein
MPNVGYATMPVMVSMRGVGAQLKTGLQAPAAAAGQAAGADAGRGISSGVGSALSGIAGTAGKVIAGAGAIVGAGLAVTAGAALKGGLSRALNIQDARSQLVGLKFDTEAVDQVMQNALASVKGTAFGLDTAATLAGTVVAAGIKPGKELERTLKLTADAATIAKVPLSEMGDIVGKVASGQKLTTEVLQQFTQRGVPLLQMVAKQYGVTGAEAAKMVTEGKVDFEGFQKALETNIGGAALSSGSTARGAWANVMAAGGRLGAMFLTGGVAAAPALFTSLGGAIDRGGESIKPFAELVNKGITAALVGLSGWLDRIDFTAFGARLATGATTAANVLAYVRGFVSGEGYAGPDLGWLEGPAERIGYIVIGIQVHAAKLAGFIGYVRGYMSGEGYDGIDIGWLEKPAENVAEVLIALRNAGRDIGSGDLNGAFSSMGASLQALTPAFAAFGDQLPNIAGATVQLAGAGLTVLVGVLGFLADHVDTIIAFMPLIVAGFVAWRLASSATAGVSIALRTAELAAIPAQIARNVLRLQAAKLEYSMARATAVNTGAQNAQTGAAKRGLIATIAAKGAMLAARGATLVAAGAQWVLNAAMSANPIGIVVLALAALVAAVVWVATQTTFFQDAWKVTMDIVGGAATWLWETIIRPVFEQIGAIFRWVYDTIIVPVLQGIGITIAIVGAIISALWTAFVQPSLNAIGMAFTWLYLVAIKPAIDGVGMVINWLWLNVISPTFALIGAIFTWIYASIIKPTTDWISAAIGFVGLAIQTWWTVFVKPALDAAGAAFQWIWANVIKPVTDWISGAIRVVGDTVRNVMGGIAGVVGDAFRGAMELAKGPINGLIGLVNGAIGAINGLNVTIPDWVPEIGGTSFSPNLPTIPRLARGGNVLPTPGGTLAILGEGGRSETVTDLGGTNALIRRAEQLAARALDAEAGDDNSVHVGTIIAADPDEAVKKLRTEQRRKRLGRRKPRRGPAK